MPSSAEPHLTPRQDLLLAERCPLEDVDKGLMPGIVRKEPALELDSTGWNGERVLEVEADSLLRDRLKFGHRRIEPPAIDGKAQPLAEQLADLVADLVALQREWDGREQLRRLDPERGCQLHRVDDEGHLEQPFAGSQIEMAVRNLVGVDRQNRPENRRQDHCQAAEIPD
jgi:hypothetical protein